MSQAATAPANVWELFDNLFDRQARRSGVIQPPTNIAEDASGYLVEMELPGIEEGAIDLQVKNRILSVKAERKLQVPNDKFRWHRVETASGSYERLLTLPEGIDGEGIRASFRNGLLSIALPKLRRQEDCRRISINAG
ncbi:MAG: hypothetical protein RL095_1159 [Verrucomicrobiota bacterium]|jgi:HSP20 family protein